MKPVKQKAVFRRLYREITAGILPWGSKLPGELKLVQQFGVSRKTIRGALKMLEQERLLRRAPGYGTYIRYCGSKLPPKILWVSDSPLLPSTVPPWDLLWKTLEEKNIAVTNCSISDFDGFSDSGLEHFLAAEKITMIVFRGSFLFFSDESLVKLKHSALPVMLLLAGEACLIENHIAGIAYDLKSAWGEGLSCLAARGHRRIGTVAMVKYGQIRGYTGQELKSLYRQLGLEYSREYILRTIRPHEAVKAENGEFSCDIDAEVGRMLALPSPPTAFICSNDNWAVSVYESLKRRQLRIPGDIAVMGFVSGRPAADFSPVITTFRFDSESFCRDFMRIIETAPVWNRSGNKVPVFKAKLILQQGESI